MAVVLLGITIAVLLGQYVLPPLPGFTQNMKFEIVGAPVLILLYKLVIRRLGEHPRDDLHLDGSSKPLLAGLGIGFVIFAAVVGIAAVFGIYHVVGEGDASGLPAALVGPAVFAAVSEEMLFRGVLFRWIEEFGGMAWSAATVTAGALYVVSRVLSGLRRSSMPA